jgi:hypothetical protein
LGVVLGGKAAPRTVTYAPRWCRRQCWHPRDGYDHPDA